MRLHASSRLMNVRDGADAMMQYLDVIPAYIEKQGQTDDFDTNLNLERSKEIANQLRDLVAWTGTHRTLTKTRREEYRRLRDDFEELTGTLSWVPIINYQLSKLRSFRRKRRQVPDTSPFVPPEMIQLRTAAECLLADLDTRYTFPRNELKRAKRATIIGGLEDLLSWIERGQTIVTVGAFNKYRLLRGDYEDLTEMLECTPILNHVGALDDEHQDQLVRQQRAQSLN